MSINIGKILKGYCNGYFGESYEDKTIIAEGDDWIVTTNIKGLKEFATFCSSTGKQLLIDEWSKEEVVI